MIIVYCDEDVDVLIKPLLEAKGFIVRTSREEKMLGAADQQQMDYATRKGYLFLTHNRVHYEQIYSELATESKGHPGIVIATRRNVYELAKRLSRVLSQYTVETLKNRILYI